MAQEKDEKLPYKVESDKGSCELNRAFLDMLLSKAKKGDQIVFVISRLGSLENSKISQVRLEGALFSLTVGKDFPAECCNCYRQSSRRPFRGVSRILS